MTTTSVPAGPTHPARPHRKAGPLRRFAGIVTEPQSYRNLAYLLLGLPLGTAWFTLLVTGVTVSVSLLVIALIGIPLLWACWHLARWCADVERRVAAVLLGQPLRPVGFGPAAGNVWIRLRAMSQDADRWRELAFLLLRFPVGIATFILAVTALATPVLVALAPVTARLDDSQPFGDWSQSTRIEDLASASPWSWLLVPLGLALIPATFHLLDALARVSGRWATGCLGVGDGRDAASPRR